MILKEVFWGILLVLGVLLGYGWRAAKVRVRKPKEKNAKIVEKKLEEKKLEEKRLEKKKVSSEEKVTGILENVITVTQACEIFNVPKSQIYKLIHSKKIVACKDKKLWKLRRDSLEKYLADKSG